MTLNFTPSENKPQAVPYFEDVTRDAGWQGYTTTKSLDRLQDEVVKAIGRLGGIVSGLQRGTFHIDDRSREGFQVHYAIKAPGGAFVPGRLDIAALPVRKRYGDNPEKALKMALYMLRTALDGMWFMQQLSPGYAPLMPWMLNSEGKTVSQLWAESPMMSRLLPPGESEFVEGEVVA